MKGRPYQYESILTNKKKILFDCREKITGRKMTPNDVHSMIRAKLEPYEYDEEH